LRRNRGADVHLRSAFQQGEHEHSSLLAEKERILTPCVTLILTTSWARFRLRITAGSVVICSSRVRLF